MKLSRLLFVTTLVMMVFCLMVPAQAKEFYEGKTIKCMVPYPPGGGTDTFFRTFVEFWQKNVPGQPKMIIQNMAGAGGLTANNFVYEAAKPDGMTVLTAPWLSMSQVTKQPGARMRYEEMGWIGGVAGTLVGIARHDIVEGGVKDPANIKNAKNVIIGGFRASSNLDIRSRLSVEILGLPYKYVPGFRGGAKVKAAMLRGEVTYFGGTLEQYIAAWEKPLTKAGEGNVLWYYPTFDAKGEPISHQAAEEMGIQRFDKVYEKMYGKKPSGEKWEAFKWFQAISNNFGLSGWLPPKAPKEALEALRIGWKKTETDPAFIEASIKRFGAKMNFATLEIAEHTLETYIKTPDQKMVDWFINFIKAGEK